jgi:magnesium transporter
MVETMFSVSTFYFSRIYGSKVYTESGKNIGRIKDIFVDLSFVNPKVVAARLSNNMILDTTFIDLVKEKGQYAIYCKKIKEIELKSQSILSLSKNMLDRQIVDINGKKVVRVNDIRLAIVSTGTYLIAVDVGFEGLLRRLSVAKPLKVIMNFLGLNIPSKLILWDDFETVEPDNSGMRLSTESEKLATLHPSDLADIIEDFDKNTQAAVFASLDGERAADVLEEMETDTQIKILDSLTVERAADVLELMPSDEVADILDELEDERAEKILQEMNKETSDEVRELMEYDDNTVGSLMSTDYITFNKELTVNEALLDLRKQKPELDTIFYLYVVNSEEKLIATVSLRDLVVSEPEVKLKDIMNTNLLFVYDYNKIDLLTEIVTKYNLLAVPVVDKHETMLGIVVINDVVYNLLKSRRIRI